jgi:prepilin-type N-terminal cleavage/methylation domain-containing protein
MQQSQFRVRGFTMIELLSALVILAILLATAGPVFSRYLAETRARSAMAHMQTLFRLRALRGRPRRAKK